jgi:2-C-methyl-D-erythritol 4-phosphate cytidylyltransferase
MRASAKAQAILVAGGAGSRFRSETRKQLVTVAGKPLVVHALERLQRSGAIDRVIIVLPRDGYEEAKRAISPYVEKGSPVDWTPGGASRQESMIEGLSRIEPFEGLVAVHDAARPAVPPSLVASVVEAASAAGGAIAALPVVETLKEASSDLNVERTVPRERLYRAQTPQCFEYDLLRQAVARALEEGFTGTDEASLVERLGAPIRIVLGSEENLKVTTIEDLGRVEYYLRERGA